MSVGEARAPQRALLADDGANQEPNRRWQPVSTRSEPYTQRLDEQLRRAMRPAQPRLQLHRVARTANLADARCRTILQVSGTTERPEI